MDAHWVDHLASVKALKLAGLKVYNLAAKMVATKVRLLDTLLGWVTG